MNWRRQAAGVAIGLWICALFAGPAGLRAAGGFLVIADPVARADALYVFPGGVPQRAMCAAALYRRGTAPAVVVTGRRIRPELSVIGMPLDDADINARVLTDQGVPRDAIIALHEGTSTWEDAHAVRKWAVRRAEVRSLIAVTSPHHSRRARRTLRRVFSGTDIDVRVQPCPAGVDPEWWRHEDTLVRVVNEYLKLGYYTLVY